MFYWAIVFLFVAVVAGIFGFGGVASTSVEMAKVLFFVSLVLFVLTSISGFLKRPTA